jgi:hypothetical protein
MSEFYDSPQVGSQLLYETDTVPFLQIVLSGSVNQFGTPLNASSFSRDRLLRHIEYGIYPSFIVAGCESLDLFRTAQEDFYSANFNDWKEYILEAYRTADALTVVRGREIIGHTVISEGFIRVDYEDGARVYVNYTDKALTDGDIEVEASGYKVSGGSAE